MPESHNASGQEIAHPGWGVNLEGDKFDLLDWSTELQSPFDPFVARVDQHRVLRAAALDTATSSVEAQTAAIAIVERLNSIMRLARNVMTVTVGSYVFEFRADGTVGRHVVVTLGTAYARGRSKAVGISTAPPRQSNVQTWAAQAERNDLLADAAIYLSRGGWFDIYKALETIDHLCDGNLREKQWISASELRRLRQTANAHRHFTKGKHQPPATPVELHEARKILATIIRCAFDEQRGP